MFVLGGVFFLLAGLLLARLSSGPLDVDFARDYIEQALYDPVSGHSVRLGRVVLEWPDLHGPLSLRLYRAALIGKDRHRVLAIDEVEVGVSGRALLAGRIRPITITLEKPALRLIRAADGHISFNVVGDDDENGAVPDDDTAVALRMRDALEQIEARFNPDSPLARLRGIEINGASVLLEDHVLGMSWYLPDFDISFARDEAGLVMTSTLGLPGTAEMPSRIQFNAAYSSRKGGALHAHLTLENVDPRILSAKIPSLAGMMPPVKALNGGVDVALDREMNLSGMRLELTVDDVAVAATATVEKTENGLRVPLRVTIPDLPQEKIAALWPEAARGSSLEEWLAHHLSEGKLENVKIGLTLGMSQSAPEAAWEKDVTDVKASFDISGMAVDYRAPLTPARDVKAKGTLADDVLSIDIEEGKVGALAVSRGKVTINHIIEPGESVAAIQVALRGPLPAVFDYIAAEPIEMSGDKLGLDVKDVKGDADLVVDINFPALKDIPADLVKVKVEGTLNGVFLPNVVKTLPLTGGPFSLKVGDGQVTLKSDAAKLDGKPLSFSWQQYLESAGKPFSSRVTASIVSDDELRAKLGLGIEDWVGADMPVDVVYTEMQDGSSTVEVKADVTKTRLMVKPFAFEKPPGVAGTAQCVVLMKDGVPQEVRDLTVKAKAIDIAKGHLSFSAEKGETILRAAAFPSARLGDTDASLTLAVAANGQMKFDVNGKFVDARPFLDDDLKQKKKDGEPGSPVLVSLDADRVRTNKDRVIDKVSLDLDLNKDGLVNRMKLDATAGQGPLFIQIGLDVSGRLALRFEAADAGATLRAFGIYDNVRGGTLAVSGTSVDPARPRVLLGRAEMKDFRVINAPALARLVSAISPTGLPQLLSNEGLYFARLDAEFDWHMRVPGDLYIVRDGRSSGSSLGLTFSGIIDKEKDVVDLEGHVVPLSEVNNLIGNIPVVGNILTGGDGALFAATYRMRGPAKDPNVSVNPLSVLAPGILRRILFESGD